MRLGKKEGYLKESYPFDSIARFLLAGFAIFALSALLLVTPTYANSTPTTCGTSHDGGSWGYAQISENPNPSEIDGGAIMKHYYGPGANAELDGVNSLGGYYYIAGTYFSATGQIWDSNPRNYGSPSARIIVYDGGTSSGTFIGVITNSVASPACNIQTPSG